MGSEVENDGSSSTGTARLFQEQISCHQQQLGQQLQQQQQQQQLQQQLQQYQAENNNILFQIARQLQALNAPGVHHQQQSAISHTQSDRQQEKQQEQLQQQQEQEQRQHQHQQHQQQQHQQYQPHQHH
ncbi:hypothetical protein BG004_006382 [Podila humilis]|nr:hypothetical protein BG004_006382 [Podila humilis]